MGGFMFLLVSMGVIALSLIAWTFTKSGKRWLNSL